SRGAAQTHCRRREPNSQRGQTGRHPHLSSNQVRAPDQPEDGKNARPHLTVDPARPRRRGDRMSTRRDFITLLGGALADQAIPAKAQEPVRVRTVGVLIGFANDAEAKARVKALEQGLERDGWFLGQNLRIEYRYAEGDSTRMQALAKELVELKLDCIL